MQRRDFLTGAGVAAMLPLASTQAAPAELSPLPAIRWRLASSFPKSLDTIYGAAETLSKRVAALTSGRFQIRVFAGGAGSSIGDVDAHRSDIRHAHAVARVRRDATIRITGRGDHRLD